MQGSLASTVMFSVFNCVDPVIGYDDARVSELARAEPARAKAEIWRKRRRDVGLDFGFSFMPFAELIRRTLAGRLQMVDMSWNAGPDGEFFLGLAYGPNAGQSNDARFRLPAYDALAPGQNTVGSTAV